MQTPRAATLWLPLQRPRWAWAAALLAVLFYALGMSGDLSFYDSGELAVAALQLGLSHPPGQPLYTLLGFAFSRLTPGAPLLGLSFLSALAGGLTLLPGLSLAERMAQPGPDRRDASWLLPLALLIGSQHAALWEQATRVEVYSLAVLLCLWCAARGAYLLGEGVRAVWPWLGLGLALGLAASVNPVLIAFVACAATPALWQSLARRSLGVGQIALLVLGGLLGLSPYLYVPIVAGRSDVLVWGAPVTPGALADYLSGRDFASNLSVSGKVWLEQMVGWLGFSLDFVLLPLWGVGLVAHAMYPLRGLSRAFAPLLCLLSVGYLARYVSFVPEIPDFVSYASMATWSCLVGCAVLVARLAGGRLKIASFALLAVLSATVLLAPPRLLSRTRRHDRTARRIAEALLESAPRGAILLVGPDHWVTPLWYLQEIESKRNDVVVMASGLLSSSWYFEHLFRRHPDLTRAALVGPGGQLGRLSRLLAANPARPVLFDEPAQAAALGLSVCVHRLFAAARTACRADEHEQAAALWEELREDVADGEPTSLGVLAAISYQRGLMLVEAGDLPAALRTLLSATELRRGDLALPLADLAVRLPRPAFRRAIPLGDPARNLYLAAQLAMAAGAPKQGLTWMVAARELGLPEAQSWLAAVSRRPPQ